MDINMIKNSRYSRQILLDKIKKEGQDKLAEGRVIIMGCGALGTNIANNLVRGGIGLITVVDRDIIELNNLQRQNLYNEKDVGLPKASVLSQKLKKINSDIRINVIVDDINNKNIEKFIKNSNIVLDGTDNMQTRFLINDVCVKNNIPWIYGGAIETEGMTMNIIPQKTPCLRCLIENIPNPGSLPTCDTIGVLNTIPNVIANIQTTEAIKIILNKKINDGLIVYNIWSHDFNNYKIKRRSNCECCGKHNFEYLSNTKNEDMISICGSGAIQITPENKMSISFENLAIRLKKVGKVDVHPIILRLNIKKYEINIFRDGRAIITGTNDKKIAKSLYTKYIGL
jgi:adenylyltransferase/sulfurtransferase